MSPLDGATQDQAGRGGRSLRAHLVVVVVAALVPMILFSIGVATAVWSYQRQEIQRQLQDTARALATAVDRQINDVASTLLGLVAASSLEDFGLIQFYNECKLVLPTQPGWRALRLLTPDGEQVFNTLAPFGAELPRAAERGHIEEVTRTRRPVVSSLFVSTYAPAPTIEIAVPVIRDGALIYIFSASLAPEAFESILQAQDLRSGALAGILDREHSYILRSRNRERFLGAPPVAPLLTGLRQASEGIERVASRDGPPVYIAWSNIPSSAWTLTLGTPAAPLEATLTRGLLMLLATGAASLLLGAFLATMLGRRVAWSIAGAASAAVKLARGEPFEPVETHRVAEIATLMAGLGEAGAVLERASRERALAEDERARLLRSEQEARGRAEVASRAKDEFLAMLGHELRNPLAAINNAAYLAQHMGADRTGDVTGRAWQVVARQSSNLTRIVDDLLDVGRIITGKVSLECQPLELATAAEHALGTLGTAGTTVDHQLTCDAEPVWVHGDATRVEQIIGNLLTNAIKYTPPGGRIHLSVTREQDMAVLRVKDTGLGLSPELVERVFEPFVQGERGLDRSQGGLGVGLTIVRRLVELHGGTIAAESPGPGQGSTFTLRLPAIPAQSMKPRPHEPQATTRQPLRILVVEDNADARQTLRGFLELCGHEITEAEDGRAGVDAAATLGPDMAVIDIGLPGLDGYHVAELIRGMAHGCDIYLVALTGYGGPEARSRAIEAGFDEHLVKPVSPQRLERVIEAAQARRELQRVAIDGED